MDLADLVAIPCPVCLSSFSSRMAIKNHMKAHHPNAGPKMHEELSETLLILFPEKEPTTKFGLPRGFGGQRRGRWGLSYECDKCSKEFMNFSVYRNHEKMGCNGPKIDQMAKIDDISVPKMDKIVETEPENGQNVEIHDINEPEIDKT